MGVSVADFVGPLVTGEGVCFLGKGILGDDTPRPVTNKRSFCLALGLSFSGAIGRTGRVG